MCRHTINAVLDQSRGVHLAVYKKDVSMKFTQTFLFIFKVWDMCFDWALLFDRWIWL